MKTSVCKSFSFEAAHYLPGYDGKCRNLHGHTWKLEVEVSGPIDEAQGFVVDFSKLKAWVTKDVIEWVDHTCLNESLSSYIEDSLGVVNPTCENILDWIWNQLLTSFLKAYPLLKLERLRLYETPDSYAEIEVGN